MENNKSVSWLAEQVIHTLIDSGVKEYVAWSDYASHYKPVIYYFDDNSCGLYDETFVAGYLQYLDERLDREEISIKRKHAYVCAMMRIKEYHDTGAIQHIGFNSARHLYPGHEALLQEFIDTDTALIDQKTIKDAGWAVRKYLYWLQRNGVRDVLSADSYQFSAFLKECHGTCTPNSVYDIQLYLRKFYSFLSGQKGCAMPYEYVLSLPVKRERRVFTPLTVDEIKRSIAQIDRTTAQGKRDYAIVLLSARCGIRACDIIHLKLNDFDWKNQLLVFVQQKTKVSISIPVPDDVAEAVKEYIIEARPKTDGDIVFLRACRPFYPFSSSVAIMHIWTKYEKLADVPRVPRDGRGFHSLRRALGKQMNEAEIPVSTIAQILGHSDSGSVKPYISVDTVHLKECAIQLDGMAASGEVYGNA